MLTTANRSSSTTLSVDHRELDAARALLGVVVSPLPTTVPPPSTRSSSAAADVTETLSLSVMAEPNENVYVGATDRLAFPAMSVPTSSSASLTEGNCAADVTMSEGDKAEYELPTARSSDDDYFCMMAQTNSSDAMATEDFPFRKRSRAESVGLDALAALASQEQAKVVSEASTMTTTGADSVNGADSHCSNNSTSKVSFAAAAASPITSSSSSDEDSAESMPPPPPRYRRRRAASNPEGMEKWDSLQESERHHFVLPASILEVELAEASAAVEQQGRRLLPKIREDSSHQPEDEHEQEEEDDDEEEEVVDESTLTPEELLRRARSRLLEDLSECTVNGEKGVITLPHALGKYKEVYNKNGRIGIYTPAERAAIIERFQRKRSRRVWNKKIRYNCRKSLADRRLRVKGRFVKRSEQEQLERELQEKSSTESAIENDQHDRNPTDDEDLPDMNDPDAGFVPTEDQPYRRLRRHTIT